MIKYVVLGTSNLTIQSASAFLDAGAAVLALIAMPESVRPDNSADLDTFARRQKIDYHEVLDINSPESTRLLQEYYPDYIFCGWPHIMKREVLEIPRYFCIGTHPTELPFNRGRHPLHWLIALGIPMTAMTFFRMDEGVDSGNLLLQVPFEITTEAKIGDAIAIMNRTCYEGTIKLHTKLLDDPGYSGVKQDHGLANYWRKRTPHDVTLDMRMSSSMILRTVRSFAPPYPCADLIFEEHILKIHEASVVEITRNGNPEQLLREQLLRMEPGKIISIKGRTIKVKADDAIVALECMNEIPSRLLRAKYIHPPTKYLARGPNILNDA